MSENAGDSSTTKEKIHKPNRGRNVSGELDVFEATRYFSDFNEPITMEHSRIQNQKQSIVTELRQNRVHPETEDQLPEPRVVTVKPQEKEIMTRGSRGKLTSFLNSLLRASGLKKSKSKSTPEVETPRGERRRRHSCVVTLTTHAEASSPILGADAWSLNTRRRSFDEKYAKSSNKSDQKINITFSKSLCTEQKVECRDRNVGEADVNGGYESDSDLFELDLFDI